MSFNQNEVVIADFSGIYQQENFYKSRKTVWLELQNIPGTNCYCDEDAIKLICERIKDRSTKGIHFIDSGNYHYMSRLWIEKIQEPFRLLVFDNHTDMQQPAFGGILSCGGWITASLTEIPFLKEVILVGPSKSDFYEADDQYKAKVMFLSREELAQKDEETKKTFFENIPLDIPIYISVDKDILHQGDAETSWTQGDMSLDELLRYLTLVLKRIEAKGQRLMGIDICGEADDLYAEKNDYANKRLLDLFFMFFGEKEGSNQNKDGGGYEK